MKKIFSILAILGYTINISSAQNTPSGANVPDPPIVPLITMPADISLPGSAYNFTRSFAPFAKTTEPGVFDLSTVGLGTLGSVKVTTSYVNGWGANIETISRGSGLSGSKDVVVANDIRPSLTHNSFLPYTVNSISQFQSTPFTDQQAYYSGNYPLEGNMSYAQSKSGYVGGVPTTNSYQPGSSFVGRGIGATSTTTFNDGTEAIIIYDYNTTTNTVDNHGFYGANELLVKNTYTPNNGEMHEYIDRSGKEICKMVYTSGANMLVTYYVYDVFGKMINVITPLGVEALAGGATFDATAGLMTTEVYNDYGSVIEHSVPGQAGKIYTIYDSKNRPVMEQTPLLAAQSMYHFSLYDSRGRAVVSGTYKDEPGSPTTPAYWQNLLYTTPPSSGTSSLLDYMVNGVGDDYIIYPFISVPNCEIDQVNFYDEHIISIPFNTTYISGTDLPGAFLPLTTQPYMFTQGLLTSSLTRVMDAGSLTSATDKWTAAVYFYDKDARVIQVQDLDANPTYLAYAFYNEGTLWDTHTTIYDFSGHKIREILIHNADPSAIPTTTNIVNTYEYDYSNGGRLMHEYQSIDDGPQVLIAKYTYDELGRVSKKSLGGVEEQNYDYNIRGQFTGINSDYVDHGGYSVEAGTSTFGCIISYDYGFTQARYDGSISGIRWLGADNTKPIRSYGYQYDATGKLVKADFREYSDLVHGTTTPPCSWNNNHIDFGVNNLTYDDNGNILTMNQRGVGVTGPTDMDVLTYAYVPGTNTLSSVTDAITADIGLGDFNDHDATGPADYTYDVDGNLASDANKKIVSITYNEADQPLVVTFHNGSTITNQYDASGRLVSKAVYNTDPTSGGAPASPTTTTYTYCGPFTYKDGVLQYVLHEEGRARYGLVTMTAGPPRYYYTYDYFVKDHLGNVRTVVTGNQTNAPVAIGLTDGRTYIASHEIADQAAEGQFFTKIETVRDTKPGSIDVHDLESARLNGSDSSRRIGTAIMLQVMPGDKFDLGAEGYWENNQVTDYAGSGDMLGSILEALGGGGLPTVYQSEAKANIVSSAMTQTTYDGYDAIVEQMTDNTAPRAYINYLFFDDQMNLLPQESGAIQVSNEAGAWHWFGTSDPIHVSHSGYVIIYISNATLDDVYIDHVNIHQYNSTLIQEQNYYPFGLAINNPDNPAIDVKNKFKYQGKEIQDDLGLNLYDFTARQYDPQIGRFWGIDPANQFPSGYTGMGNDPGNQIDPDGCQSGSFGGGYGSPMVQNDGQTIADIKEHMAEVDAADGALASMGFAFIAAQNAYRESVFGGGQGLVMEQANPSLAPTPKPSWKILPMGSVDGVSMINGGSREEFEIHAHSGPSLLSRLNEYLIPVNETFNPLYMVLNGVYAPITGKDIQTGAPTNGMAALAAIPLILVPGGQEEVATARSIENTALKYTVYRGVDEAGVVRYGGITFRDLQVRAAEHIADGGGKELLRYEAVYDNLSKTQARIFEQMLINEHGLQKNGGTLLNKINSIAPSKWSTYGILK